MKTITFPESFTHYLIYNNSQEKQVEFFLTAIRHLLELIEDQAPRKQLWKKVLPNISFSPRFDPEQGIVSNGAIVLISRKKMIELLRMPTPALIAQMEQLLEDVVRYAFAQTTNTHFTPTSFTPGVSPLKLVPEDEAQFTSMRGTLSFYAVDGGLIEHPSLPYTPNPSDALQSVFSTPVSFDQLIDDFYHQMLNLQDWDMLNTEYRVEQCCRRFAATAKSCAPPDFLTTINNTVVFTEAGALNTIKHIQLQNTNGSKKTFSRPNQDILVACMTNTHETPQQYWSLCKHLFAEFEKTLLTKTIKEAEFWSTLNQSFTQYYITRQAKDMFAQTIAQNYPSEHINPKYILQTARNSPYIVWKLLENNCMDLQNKNIRTPLKDILSTEFDHEEDKTAASSLLAHIQKWDLLEQVGTTQPTSRRKM